MNKKKQNEWNVKSYWIIWILRCKIFRALAVVRLSFPLTSLPSSTSSSSSPFSRHASEKHKTLLLYGFQTDVAIVVSARATRVVMMVCILISIALRLSSGNYVVHVIIEMKYHIKQIDWLINLISGLTSPILPLPPPQPPRNRRWYDNTECNTNQMDLKKPADEQWHIQLSSLLSFNFSTYSFEYRIWTDRHWIIKWFNTKIFRDDFNFLTITWVFLPHVHLVEKKEFRIVTLSCLQFYVSNARTFFTLV